MKTETMTLAAAMDVLARDIQSDDGVANAAIVEAAQRLREQEWEIAGFVTALERARKSLRFFKEAGFHEDRARGQPDVLEIVERAIGSAKQHSPNANDEPRRT